MITTTASTTTLNWTDHERRLRKAVKQLVVELGYVEQCLAAGLQDSNLQIAATSIDTAIDRLNDHLSS